ncbi:MAG: hypothetical protein J7M25_05605 [Deltaproteobacteria bacterium]|nr:hypothetical protein [Deltaproteobacteria bacterium]
MPRKRMSAREIARKNARTASSNQLWFVVGVLGLALVALLGFRKGCSHRVGSLFETLDPSRDQDARPVGHGAVDGGILRSRDVQNLGRKSVKGSRGVDQKM